MQDYTLIGPALYISSEKTLVIGDLHIGTDDSLAESGALSPVLGISQIRSITESLISKTKPNRVILLGDLEVHFGSIPYKQKEEIRKYLQYLKDNTKELIILIGNHDKQITKIFQEQFTFQEKFETNNFFFCHGDKIIPTNKKYIIIGHEHPAITLTNNIRTEKFKCTLIGPYNKNQTLIVLPSLNQTNFGTNMLELNTISPYLTKDILNDLTVFAIEKEEIFKLKKIKDLI